MRTPRLALTVKQVLTLNFPFGLQDRFTDSTPYGDREFTNLVFTFDKDAPRRIVLAAHFDSKYFPAAPDNEVRLLE